MNPSVNPVGVVPVTTSPAPVDTARGQPGGPPLGAPANRPYQVSPGMSSIDMAARALHVARGMQPSYGTLHSARHYAMLRGEIRNDALIARGVVNQITRRMMQLQDPKLDELLRQFPDADDPDQLMAAMRKASLHPAAMALLLAAMAQVHNGRKRSRLEQELDGLLAAGSDWELTMLGWIEFGPMNRELAAQMKSLYQRSSLVREGLAKFFDQLLGVGERRRKIKVLIRALGAELAGLDDDPPEGARLADTVRDLKRLLMFLGCEEHCARIAATMRSAPVDADAVLRILIRMIDQFWLYPEWIENEARALSLDEDDVFRLARQFLGLTKLLAEPCFRDQDQRKQVVEALEGFITTRADEESQK